VSGLSGWFGSRLIGPGKAQESVPADVVAPIGTIDIVLGSVDR
jgi:hypothetical protein